MDPIAVLEQDLRKYGKPSLPWTVKWSAGNREPVAAAWQQSRDPVAMCYLLGFGRIGKLFRRSEWLSNDRPILGLRGLVGHTRGDPTVHLETFQGVTIICSLEHPESANEIRRVIPIPPTLAELLAARAK